MMQKLINRGLLFPQDPRVPWAYPVLAPLSRCYPRYQGRLSTRYSPVRHFHRSKLRITFDLHVLSTPPAFVLSQDQTLQFNFKTGKSDSSLKQLTCLLQKPTMLFRLLFSFQRPSRQLLSLRQTRQSTRTGATCQHKVSRFFRRADPVDRSGMSVEHQVWYLSPRPFSCRFLFGCKELPCEPNFITKAFPAVNLFLPHK